MKDIGDGILNSHGWRKVYSIERSDREYEASGIDVHSLQETTYFSAKFIMIQ